LRDLQRGAVGRNGTRRVTLAPKLDSARIEAPRLLAAIALPGSISRALAPLRLARANTVYRPSRSRAGT
jgi:hypothetical protein